MNNLQNYYQNIYCRYLGEPSWQRLKNIKRLQEFIKVIDTLIIGCIIWFLIVLVGILA